MILDFSLRKALPTGLKQISMAKNKGKSFITRLVFIAGFNNPDPGIRLIFSGCRDKAFNQSSL